MVEVGGVGLMLTTTSTTAKRLPRVGEKAFLFSYLHVKEDALDLYGFSDAEERSFFELLLTVSGVGPRSALAVLEVAHLAKLKAAIVEGRADLLTQASGVGKKIAERIVLELKAKVRSLHPDSTIVEMEGDSDIVEALTGLGYKKETVREIVAGLPGGLHGFDVRLKSALKTLGGGKKKNDA